ncbi:MAG: hypothetical protein CVT94_13895 [Bacteroidetes bacterium HGW-Bacteroidetes-11]|jgi:hypothetical protein|nr:MAG: hypothetical protein CVT94_13895 [Bacteroidetes bacterium HGW-Bacteroidetes-11]
MKNTLPIALLLIATIVFSVKTTQAQTENFKLSDYKNPDYLYQSLVMNFNFSNGFVIQRNGSQENEFGLNSAAGGNYLRYLNSTTRQAETQLGLNAGFGISNRNQELSQNYKTDRKSFNHGESFQFSTSQRFYNTRQHFFETSVSLSSNFSGSKQSQNNSGNNIEPESSKMKYKNFRNDINAAIYVGKGRIEQVQDAQMAVFLLNDLQLLNRKNRDVSDEEVLELATLITKLKYKRFFDSRLRRIAEITAIDSFMQAKKISGITDAMYFTSLNDNWAYANNPIRQSGYRGYIGLEGNLSLRNATSSRESDIIIGYNPVYDNTDRHTGTGAFLLAGYLYEKPISLKWQKSAQVRTGFGISRESNEMKDRLNDLTTKNYAELFPSISLSADYGYGFYPNTRTWATFNWTLLAAWNKEMTGETKEDKTDLQKLILAQTGPEISVYYYISPKLRLNANFSSQLRIIYQELFKREVNDPGVKGTTTRWSQGLNASLSYSIF